MICRLVYCRIVYAAFNDATCTVYIECLNTTAKHNISHFHSHLISGDQIENNENGEACSTYWGDRVLMRKPDGKRQLGRPRCRWEGNIKTDLQGVDVEAWTGLIRLRIRRGGEHL